MPSAGRVRLRSASVDPACGVSVVGGASRAEIRRLAASWAERTAIEQGLPAVIEDEATLREVATLLCAGRDDPRGIRPAKRG
jgi:hypothetical protein